MSCASNEALIALYVEGDLPARDVPSLATHLATCVRCGTFRDELRASQATLKSLGQTEIPEAPLERVRRRTLGAVGHEIPLRRPLLAPGWGLAIGVAVLAAVGLWSGSTSHPHPTAIQATTALPQRAPAGRPRPSEPTTMPDPLPQPAVAPPRSTIRPPAPVSPSKGAEVVEASTRLSPQDADQLARAVVEVSRVERLAAPDAASGPTEPGTLLVRLDTDDPNVVIYWQVDANGG